VRDFTKQFIPDMATLIQLIDVQSAAFSCWFTRKLQKGVPAIPRR
jgi:hypothetical protein